MKKTTLYFVLFLFSVGLVAQSKRQVFGTITDGKSPLQDVKITNLDTNFVIVTDESGKYSIEAKTGNNIQFSHVGFKTIIIKVEDVTRVLNPTMVLEVTELQEVVVTETGRESQQKLRKNFVTDKRIVRTVNGFMNTDWAVGFVRVIGEEEISPADNCILGLLKNRTAEVSVQGSCNGPMLFGPMGGSFGFVYVNSNSLAASGPAIFDVDGELHFSTPIWLDVKNIKRVAILNDIASKMMYGGVAIGGVIVINTSEGFKNSFDNYDEALLTDNFITGKVLLEDEVNKNNPGYLKELTNSTSFAESKKIYLAKSEEYKSSPYFFLDAYNHFYNNYKEKEFTDGVIEDNFRLFEGNAVLLKALAYSYESQKRYDKAHELYKEIFILRPTYSQSFLDIANSYRNINSNKLAAGIYTRYDYLMNEGFAKADTTVFKEIFQREYNNLLALHKDEIMDSNKAEKVYVAEEDFKGTRLVFEWNDSEAEFDLQFVNPGNRYYTWNHSISENPDTIYSKCKLLGQQKLDSNFFKNNNIL
jgi:tetratricopeptide (TPR) repeat protein